METIFTYGTLQNEGVQLAIFGRILNGVPEVLTGYAKMEIWIQEENQKSISYPIIKKTDEKNARIEGVLFEITERELHLADDYETAKYQRIYLSFDSGKKGWVYVSL